MGALSAYMLPAGDLVADIGGADGSLLAVLLASEPDKGHDCHLTRPA